MDEYDAEVLNEVYAVCEHWLRHPCSEPWVLVLPSGAELDIWLPQLAVNELLLADIDCEIHPGR